MTDDLISVYFLFSNKSGAIIVYLVSLFFWFIFYLTFFFTFKSFPVVGLVKLSRADVKQSDFKNNNNLTKKNKRQNEDPKGRTIGRGAQYVVRECVCFPHTNFMRHSWIELFFFGYLLFFLFLIVGYRSCDGTCNCILKYIFHISLFTTFTYALCTK